MRKIWLIGLVLLVWLSAGCASMVESVKNAKTIYGDTKIQISDNTIYYKMVHHKDGLFTMVSDEVLTDIDDKRKKFGYYFIAVLKEEFRKKTWS